jgi:hypothetical protein
VRLFERKRRIRLRILRVEMRRKGRRRMIVMMMVVDLLDLLPVAVVVGSRGRRLPIRRVVGMQRWSVLLEFRREFRRTYLEHSSLPDVAVEQVYRAKEERRKRVRSVQSSSSFVKRLKSEKGAHRSLEWHPPGSA